MKPFVIIAAVFLSSVFALSCEGEQSTEASDDSVVYPILLEYDRFRFSLYKDVSAAQAVELYDSLNANADRIMNHLRVPTMPQVNVSIWARAHSNDYYAHMQTLIGQVYPGANGYTPDYRSMCLLWDSTIPKGSVHEYAHLVSIALKRNISNNPRWLWEAIAQYESGMYSHASLWPPSERVFPGFGALNQFNSELPYRWGYYLVACIIEHWGEDAYINLLKANGNIETVLGVTESEFGGIVNTYILSLLPS